jgi:hypothetical protein
MLERQYRLDPWLTLAAVLVPVVASLPFLHGSPWTQADASLVLSVKTLGLFWAPGYPAYLLATRALGWALPLGAWGARLQLLHVLYLAALSGLVFRLGRTLLFPPLACFSASLGLVFTAWIWPEVLLPSPLMFHLDLLFLFLGVTLARLTSPPGRYPRFGLLVWGALGGLTGGQELILWAWVVPAMALGAWLSPGKRTWRFSSWGALGAGLAAGALLPYAYVLARLFSSHAFINTDLVPQLAAWRDAPSWDLLQNWLGVYFRAPHFWLPSLGSSLPGVLPVLGSLPFLTLCCWLLGAFIHLRQLLFQPVHPPASEPAQAARLVAGSLPLLAVAGTALFFSQQAGALPLAWIVGGTLWGFSGFNYLYEELGRPSVPAAKLKLSTTPSAFAVLVLVLVPLLSWMQTVPRLQALSRQALEPAAPLAQARTWLRSLPPRALLVFPRHSDGHALAYLQTLEGLRPDVRLQALSAVWPGKPYTGRTVLELLGATPEARQRRRLNFAEYWNQELRGELAAGSPAFLVTGPQPPDPTLDEFLRIFELTWVKSLETRASHEDPGTRPLWIFALHPRTPPAPADRPGGRVQAAFDRSLRLVRAEGLTAGEAPGRRAWLTCRLLWEPWPGRKLQNYSLVFQVAAERAAGSAPTPASGLWALGQRPLVQVRDPAGDLPDCFWETYQLFLPPGLPDGRYRLYAALFEAGTRERVPTAKTQDPSGYGVEVGVFSTETERP